MSSLIDRIAQFQKMASDDPENELGHFRLGQLLMEDNRPGEAVESFKTTLKLSPQFSKVYQLLGDCHSKLGETDAAVAVLTEGHRVAGERGDRIPKEAMAKMLADLGAPVPADAAPVDEDDGPETGFKCERPGCISGKRAAPLAKPPLPDAIGRTIREKICVRCWESWFKDYSVKVINELRLDLSSDFGQAEYDKYMREYFGFEAEATSDPRAEA